MQPEPRFAGRRPLVLLASLLLLPACAGLAPTAGPRAAPSPAAPNVLPLALVPNAGQWPDHVRFASSGAGSVWLEREAIVLSRPMAAGKQQVVRMRVLDASPACRPIGEHAVAGPRSFFLGNDRSQWHTGLVAHDVVRWSSIRPGIDLLIRTGSGAPEYLLDLHANADLSALRIRCEGGRDLEVLADGSLCIAAESGALVQSPPIAWATDAEGGRRSVTVRFRVIDRQTFGFDAPAVAADETLCIDPVLQWSTFVGGSSNEWGYDIWREPDGTVLVVGETNSSNFPTSAGCFDPTYNGFGPPTNDVFVARINATGTGVVYATYLGGSGSDRGTGVRGDGNGTATITGAAGSSNFPTSAGAYDTTLGGNSDAFVTRLTANGTALVFSTLLGGSGDDLAEDLDVEANGDVWITGTTSSASFPTTAGAFSSVRQGTSDAFVAKISNNGTQLLASTLLGGSDGDVGKGVAVGPGGTVVIGGVTSSANFPTTPGCFQSTLLGSSDPFLARFDASCQNLLGSSLCGGSAGDVGEAVAVAPSGLMLVGGVTSSNNFPVTAGAFQSTASGSSDSFVAAFDAQFHRRWATLIGGNGGDVLKSLSVTPVGTLLLGGQCSSSVFPTTPGAVVSSGLGSADAFVVHLAADGGGLMAGTLFGGTGSDGGEAIDGRNEAAVALTGVTNSGNLPISAGAWSPSQLGTNDAFAAVLDLRTPGVVRYGTSTPACLGPIYATVGRWPAAGAADFALACTQAPPLTIGIVVIGFAPAPGFPILGISAWIDLVQPTILATAVSDDLGFAKVPLSLATVTAGGQFYAQFAWFNPPWCGVQGTLSASDALDITVQ